MRNSPLRAFVKNDDKKKETKKDREWKSYYPMTPEMEKEYNKELKSKRHLVESNIKPK